MTVLAARSKSVMVCRDMADIQNDYANFSADQRIKTDEIDIDRIPKHFSLNKIDRGYKTPII